LYSGFRAGRGITLSGGVDINVIGGGSLTLGDDCYIEQNVQITAEGQVTIGARSFVGRGSVIASSHSVIIGADALIAAYVTIRDQDHAIGDVVLPYRHQGKETSPVKIGNNVWIGTKASVLRGVAIGDGAVVGAHALVISDVESRTVVGGVPAKLLKRLPQLDVS
jgi:acetyltransferase-like isoleucine patch superfamily enzyme